MASSTLGPVVVLWTTSSNCIKMSAPERHMHFLLCDKCHYDIIILLKENLISKLKTNKKENTVEVFKIFFN